MSSQRPLPPNSAGLGPGGRPPSFTEYKLKMSPMPVLHNVMVLHSNTATLSDFTQPVRMIRDKNSGLFGAQSADAAATSANTLVPKFLAGGRSSSSVPSKKRTKLIFPGESDDELEQLRNTEQSPWLLEDFDGQHSFVGKLEGGQSSNYVFFVNQGDEFRIIPVNRWYRFYSKLSYHTLTLEEAEVAAKNRDDEVDRWLMRHRPNLASPSGSPSPSDHEDEKAPLKKAQERSSAEKKPSFARLAGKVLSAEEKQEKRAAEFRLQRQRIIRSTGEREDLDFDEIFDDDEGNDNFGGLEDEDGVIGGTPKNEISRKKSAMMTSEGRLMRKIVRHRDKQNRDQILASDEEDEPIDPYASDDQAEDLDDWDDIESTVASSTTGNTGDLSKLTLKDASTASVNVPPSAKGAKSTAAGGVTSAKLSARTGSLSQSPTPSPSTSPAASRAVTPSVSPRKAAPQANMVDAAISEAELIGHLRHGPMSTKDLISKFKRQLKADPKNKDLFRELVRKVAMVRSAAGGNADEDKLLELKPEFK